MANKKDFIYSGPTKPDVPTSRFDLSYTNRFTAEFGKIYPVGHWFVPAKTSFHVDSNFGFDLMPMPFPVQTNMRMHLKFYKAPLRILQRNWKNYVTRGGKGYELPYIHREGIWYKTGSLADYMGLPSYQVGTERRSFSTGYSRVSHAYGISPLNRNMIIISDVTMRDSLTPPLPSGVYYFVPYLDAFAPIRNGGTYVSDDNFRFSVVHSSSAQASHYTVANIVSSEMYFVICSKWSENGGLTAHTIKYSRKLTSSDVTLGSYNMQSVNGVSMYYEFFNVNLNSIFDFTAEDRYGSIGEYAEKDNYFLGVVYKSPQYLGTTSNYTGITRITDSTSLIREINVTDNKEVPTYSNPDVIKQLGVIQYAYEYAEPKAPPMYFSSSDGVKPPVLPVRAYRFRMYEFIYNYFIRNERVTPFMLPDENGVLQQVYNQFITNDGDGADMTTPIDFKYAPYEYDLFTTCVKQPTYGDAPLVGVAFNYTESGDTPTGEFKFLREGQTSMETIGVSLDSDGAVTGITNYNVDASHPNIHNLQELIDFGISINDLRNVSAYQRYLERLMKAGTKYQNIIYEFFGTNPPIGEEYPSYLGGYTENIRVDKIQNTSASNPDVPLGEFGGTAGIRGSSKTKGHRSVHTFCEEESIIMAVCWFSPTPSYSQKLDKDLVFSSYLDLMNPQFNNISPQPVYNYQIAPLECTEKQLFEVFGYNRPYAEYVSKQDEVHGQFRDEMSRFVLQRIFQGVPKLNEQFLNIYPEDVTQIFAVTDTTDKIYGEIYFDCYAQMPMPHSAVPRIV